VRVTTLNRREKERKNSGRWERGGNETEEEDGGETEME
jgi:hypothetical protein